MLSQVISRLKGKADLRKVEGVLALSAVEAVPQAPAAFVLPMDERADPNVGTGVNQRITVSFGVLLIVRKAGTREVADDLTPWTHPILDELVGWQPEGGCDAVEYRGGSLVDLQPGEVRWLMTFSTNHHYWR